MEHASKTAIVFLNMGGPENLSQVHPFLQRLFLDRDLLKLPAQSLLGRFIAKRRAPKIQDQYRQIGGGSPILHWSRLQGEKMVERLAESHSLESLVAFRYAPPLTEDCVQQLLDSGIRRAVAFSQYPQYSCCTSGSSFNELYRQLKRLDPQRQIKWSVIDRWATQPKFVEVVAKHVRAKLQEFMAESPERDVVVLFSAHSIPMSIVNRGDPYVSEVSATCNAVMQLVPELPWRLAWQSQVGPQEWMGPSTLDALKGFGKHGRKRVIVVPIAFTSDHIETLYELDLEYGEEAKEFGVQVKRAESLNDDPEFIEAISEIVSDHLKRPHPVSPQFLLQCPNCTNNACGQMRAFFNSFGKG